MTPAAPLPFNTVPFDWLKEQSVALDRMIAIALLDEYSQHRWSPDEIEAGFEELWSLSDGKDCCYDRPSIPFHYASWYHGRRLHDLVSILTTGPDAGAAISKRVIDLGCGTGSDLWAIGLLVAGLIAHGRLLRPVPLHIIALDASPFMLELAQALWQARMLKKYPALQDHIRVTFQCSNWARTSFPECAGDDRPLVIANHLMDRSDEHRIKDVAKSLEDAARLANARSLLIISSQGKAATVSQSIRDFNPNHWYTNTPERSTLAWNKSLPHTTEARSILLGKTIPHLEQRWGWSATRWEERQTPSAVRLDWALPEQQGLFAPLPQRKVILDPDQQKAATPQTGFAKITGVAGSGKTLVLADRIANTLTRSPADAPPPSIFVTAFNKGVIAIITNRLRELLEGSPYQLVTASRATGRKCGTHTERDGHFTIRRGEHTVATLMNWDLAISRIFSQPQRADESAVSHRIQRFIATYPSPQRPSWCTPEFIEAEHSRIWYGREGFLDSAYLTCDRRGRRVPLGAEERKRLAALFAALPMSFVGKRIAALNQVLRGNSPPLPRFTHVFVDEYQDFGPADFKLLYALLPTTAPELVIAGDATQALHLGAALRCPPPPTGRWYPHKLVGSYRLPLRICECLEPLSRRVRAIHGTDSDIETPSPRKSAMLGVRPILIWGETPTDRARQICEVFRLYHQVHNNCGEILIAESDPELQSAINTIWPKLSVESDTMLRCKGLERKFVVWSTRSPMTTDESTEEWAFTLMTRTLALLVIAVGPDTPPAITELTRSLRKDRLLWWTAPAREWLNHATIPPAPTTQADRTSP